MATKNKTTKPKKEIDTVADTPESTVSDDIATERKDVQKKEYRTTNAVLRRKRRR